MFFEFTETLFNTFLNEAARGVLRAVNGIKLLTTDEFIPDEPAPSRLILNQRMLKLRRYISRRRRRSQIPVLLIPPLMVKPDVFDLHPDWSFARHLVAQGFDVFLLDFGAP